MICCAFKFNLLEILVVLVVGETPTSDNEIDHRQTQTVPTNEEISMHRQESFIDNSDVQVSEYLP